VHGGGGSDVLVRWEAACEDDAAASLSYGLGNCWAGSFDSFFQQLRLLGLSGPNLNR
jgi:hypothetical protein